MPSRKLNWRFYLCLVIIICFSWVESQYVTESVAIAEGKRKLLYVLFLAGVLIVGYWYWRPDPLKWMKKVWLVAYFLMFGLLILISFLNKEFPVFPVTFLDQFHYMRVFFTSPLPFLLTIVLSRMDFRQGHS